MATTDSVDLLVLPLTMPPTPPFHVRLHLDNYVTEIARLVSERRPKLGSVTEYELYKCPGFTIEPDDTLYGRAQQANADGKFILLSRIERVRDHFPFVADTEIHVFVVPNSVDLMVLPLTTPPTPPFQVRLHLDDYVTEVARLVSERRPKLGSVTQYDLYKCPGFTARPGDTLYGRAQQANADGKFILLDRIERVRDQFPSVADTEIHVFVVPNSVDLMVLPLTTPPTPPFYITAHLDHHIMDVARLVSERRPMLGSVTQYELYKCPGFTARPGDTLYGRAQQANADGKFILLSRTKRVRDHFPSVADTEIHVFVVPDRAQPEEEYGDVLSELTPLKRRHNALVMLKEKMGIDTAEGVHDTHSKIFTGKIDDRYGHPVALFHPALALLQWRLQTLDAQVETGRDWDRARTTEGRPDKLAELENARCYFDKFRGSYTSEAELCTATQGFWDGIFGTIDRKFERRSDGVTGGSRQSEEGVGQAGVGWGNYAILEQKHVSGLRGDASLQAALWYAKLCNSMKTYSHSNFPIILIGNMGNVLEVSIAVCLEEVMVDKILHFEILSSVHYNKTVVKLALIASALKDCANELREEYESLTPTLGDRRRIWFPPSPSTVDPSPNAPVSDVKFTGKLDRTNQPLTKLEGDNIEMRSLYLATYHDQEVVVKFSAKYGTDAHHAVADGTYAPKLHFCEKVIGGQQMVVMDRVNGQRMCGFPLKSLPRSVFEDVQKALKILHSKDIVFGDLRDTNVMITTSGDGKKGAMLLDFDWADAEGKGRYPALINTELIGQELAPDISDGGLMHKKHDEYALRRLVSQYCMDTV
ncbi:hypothetical protein BDW22DRAFT_1362524 [Trametopsis cervina]|nr:hypothetical protein BDW22DRAFT_1362524 [Trametopsis cervina]